MRFARLLWHTLPLLLAVGCAQNRADLADTPTVNSPAGRAYAAPPPSEPLPLQTEAPASPAPPGVNTLDLDVAKSVRHLLHENPHLGPASKNIFATVDKGVVTLTGTVPSEHDRDEIVGRISKLPGVDRVDDQLKSASPYQP